MLGSPVGKLIQVRERRSSNSLRNTLGTRIKGPFT
jgi:hypothetical protein